MRLYSKLLSFSVSLLLLSSCTGHKQEKPEGAIQVKIPLLKEGSYQLQPVELLTVDDLVELKGWAAEFLLAPTQVGKKLDGYHPKIRVIKNHDGVYVATDELSLQLLTVYYHMEKLGMMDALVGARSVNTWPRTVAVNVNYVPKGGDGSKAENNALYSGELDSLLFVPYTESSLPIMINAGILGHEHFHSLFHKLFIKPLGAKYPGTQATLHQEEETQLKVSFNFEVNIAANIVGGESPSDSVSRPASSLETGAPTMEREARTEKSEKSEKKLGLDSYHSFMLRGLNEGLADFWGWLYSDDVDFVGQSLPQFSAQRKLEGPAQIPSDECFRASLTGAMGGDTSPMGQSYKYGSSVARNLKIFAQDYRRRKNLTREEMKVQIGTAVLNSLVSLKTSFATLKEDEALGTRQFLELLATQISDLSAEETQFLKPETNTEVNTETSTETAKEAKLCR